MDLYSCKIEDIASKLPYTQLVDSDMANKLGSQYYQLLFYNINNINQQWYMNVHIIMETDWDKKLLPDS